MAGIGKASGKGRKYGRTKNKACQQRYVNEERRDKNKRRKVMKFVNKFGKAIKVKLGGVIITLNPSDKV